MKCFRSFQKISVSKSLPLKWYSSMKKKGISLENKVHLKFSNIFVLFLTEEAWSYGGLWARELGQTPLVSLTNSSRPLEKFKGKENPDLPSVCTNYWPPNVALSLCFDHLVLSTFWQSRSAIPKRSICRAHNY